MKPKVFVTDMDDVLVELLPAWLHILNTRYNKSVKVEDIQHWDMRIAYPDLNDKQIYEILSEEQLWNNVNPKQYSQEYLIKIKEEGCSVYVCTASHYKNLNNKITNCLLKHYPWITYKDVICCHNKSIIECNYIVDDYAENIKNSKAIRFLMDAPHNRNSVQSVDYDFRVSSMKDVYNIIKQLEKVG